MNLPIENNSESVSTLEEVIKTLELEIKEIEKQLFPFEQSLRNAIADLLVEERELTILYKKQKKAKKLKRLEQKRKGKNYKESTGIIPLKKKVAEKEKDILREKKRLYKEAMLFVHPDKFSMQEEEQEKANEVTTKLIEIYKSGTLEELQNYHAHIFSGNTVVKLQEIPSKIKVRTDNNEYLKKEVERLKMELKMLLEKYTYKVLTTYEKPMSFVEELTTYYNDRIFKLKKRTRTK